MAQSEVRDVSDPWKYVIALGKFMFHVIDSGIIKSFGVLIPVFVSRYDSNYNTIAFICSLPGVLLVAAPVIGHMLSLMTPRFMGMVGGLTVALSLICAPLFDSIYLLGMMIALTGFGVLLVVTPLMNSLNTYFPKSFIFVSTLTQFGSMCGSFVMPVIVERSLDAYGYQGALLILGGISLHMLVPGAVMRPPRDTQCDFPSTTEETAPFLDSRTHGANDCSTSEQVLEIEQGRFLTSETPFTSSAHTGSDTDDHDDTTDSKANKPITPIPRSKMISCLSHFHSWLKSCIFVREPLFTLIIPAIYLEGYIRNAWMLFLVPHAEGFGVPRSRAVFLSSIASIGGMLGRIVYLVLLYFNFDSAILFCLASLLGAASFFADTVSSTFTFLCAMAFVQGFCMFTLHSLPVAMMKLSIRNEENIPKGISVYLCAIALGLVSGDTLSGLIYDVTSSFSTVFLTFGAALVGILVNLSIFAILVRYTRYGTSTPTQQ